MIRSMLGIDKVIADIKNLKDLKKQQQLQHDLVLWMKREAKRLCPVDTGQMRRTIYMRRVETLGYELGVTAHYAVWNEFGPMNRGVVPVGEIESPAFYKGGYRPFMRPAIWRGMKRLPKIFRETYDIK